MGLVGRGFVGAHHVDAVRRLGFVDVVAVCDVTQEQAAAKATALGAPKADASAEALAADPDIHVVHVTTGGKGCVSVGQVCAGHKNDLWFELNGCRGVPPGDGPCDSAMATFEDGYRAACVVDAVLDSHRQGGVWTAVRSR